MLSRKHLKQYAAQGLAELFSTFVLILIGNLGVAQDKFMRPTSPGAIGSHLSYGTGVYAGIMIAGPFTGAHMNPAVSIGMLSLRKLTVVQCLFYIIGQLAGAFLASPLVYVVYLSQFNQFDGGRRQIEGSLATGDVFYTVPAAGVPNWNCLIDSIVGTCLLLLFIMAIEADFNQLISNTAKPFALFLLITTFGFNMSLNCGNPINPARDFGPRLFAAFIYGFEVFSVNDYYFWVASVGPMIGALMGIWIWVGYLVLMKHYVFLVADNDSDVSGSLNQSQSIKEPYFIGDPTQPEITLAI